MSLTPLTRGKVARLADCNIETIRYYERIGLLAKPQRGGNGYRYYDQNHLHRLRFIKRAKQLGFTNDSIRELLEISHGPGKQTRAEVKALTENHIESVKQRIRDLQKMEETLSHISSQCDGAEESVDHCPILLSLFNDEEASDT